MTPKSFVNLAGIALVSAALALITFAAGNQWGGGKTSGEKLLPTLADSIRQVTGLEIRQGEETIALERAQNGTWSLKSRGGYPVDVTKVRALLVGLGQAELVEPKTSKSDRYAALELEDPEQKGAKSRLLRLTSSDGKAISEVVLGKRRSASFGTGQTLGTYVRKPGDPQTWLANVELDAPVTAKNWVKTSVLALDTAKISRFSVEIPGEQALRVERPAPAAPPKDAKPDAAKGDAKDAKAPEWSHPPFDSSKLAFVGFPVDGKKLKDASAAESLARAVASIDLEDVRKVAAPPADSGEGVVKVESADGVATTLRLRKEGDAHWLTVTVAGGEGDAKKAADELSARTQGWEFKIPGHKADAMLKKRADLVETTGS
jgi:Domain of unknown function (DUF4340)